VRITTTSKHLNVPTVVPLSPADPLTGYIVVDDLIQLYRDEHPRGPIPAVPKWPRRGR